MKNKCFRGRCPYTDKVCKIWLCRLCRIERREREYAKSNEITLIGGNHGSNK